MNPFAGMDPQTIASALILIGICLFFILIVVCTYVRNGVWIVFGVLLIGVILVILGLARG